MKLCTRPELVWVNSLARFGQKRWPAAFESKDPQPCGPARSKHPRCEKRHFLSHLYIKTITLPRQTRDKHRGKCALILMPALSLSWQCSSSYNRAVEKTPPALGCAPWHQAFRRVSASAPARAGATFIACSPSGAGLGKLGMLPIKGQPCGQAERQECRHRQQEGNLADRT